MLFSFGAWTQVTRSSKEEAINGSPGKHVASALLSSDSEPSVIFLKENADFITQFLHMPCLVHTNHLQNKARITR